ncbi:MAG: FAD-dependent oxidoreductase, partial [Pseudomonadales bacterium]|nr:FAD-dependent oxidoreductase [Pseudomonadales bacterium]
MNKQIMQVDVAIIGAGPAGLAAATQLRQRGVDQVVVLDREVEGGGIPRHCGHPPFGMREFYRVLTGPQYAKRLVAQAITAGVRVLTRHTITRLLHGGELEVATPDGLITIMAKRVLIATGVRETPRSARLVTGARPLGITTTGALQSMFYLKGLVPFKRPVVI